MKTTRSFLVALLIVFGVTAFANTSTDSLGINVKVLPSLESKSFRLIYENSTSDKVTVKLYDSKKSLLFSKTYASSMFVQPFDLGNLPDDSYTISVRCGKEEVKTVVVAETRNSSMPSLDFNAELNNRIARLQSSTPLGSTMRLVIYDMSGEMLYKEDFVANSTLNKTYDLSHVQSTGVSFLLFQNGKLLNEKSVKF